MGVKKEISLSVPRQFNAPWLTLGYILEHAWCPMPHTTLNGEEVWRYHTEWGWIPSFPRSEFSPGDLIIYDTYSSRDERFRVVTPRDIQNYLDKKIDLLPHGIVVHPPEHYGYSSSALSK